MRQPPTHVRLYWDDWNREHIRKHRVLIDEVEDVAKGDPIFFDSYKNHLLMIGPTASGRMLTVVIGPVSEQPGLYYVFSARSCTRKEVRLFDQLQEGGRNDETPG